MPASYVVTKPPTQIKGHTKHTSKTQRRWSRCTERGSSTRVELAAMFRSTTLFIVPTKQLLSSHPAKHATNTPKQRGCDHASEASQYHDAVTQRQSEHCTAGAIKLLCPLWLICHQFSDLGTLTAPCLIVYCGVESCCTYLTRSQICSVVNPFPFGSLTTSTAGIGVPAIPCVIRR